MILTKEFSNLKAKTLEILSQCPANNSDINAYLKLNCSDTHKGYILWNVLDHPFESGEEAGLYYYSTKKNLVTMSEEHTNTLLLSMEFQTCLEEILMRMSGWIEQQSGTHRIRQCEFSREFIKPNGFTDYNSWFSHNLIKLGEQNGAFVVERENGIKYVTSGMKYTQPKMENTFQEFISQKRITASSSESKFNQVFLKLCPSLDLIHQKTFKDLRHLKPLRYDFYTETLDGECILFEIDGKEHRNNLLNDILKTRYALNNDYTLVRIKNEDVNTPYLTKLFKNMGLL